MSIFLVGAGPDPESFPEVFDRFAAEAQLGAGPGRRPRIAVVVHDSGGAPITRLPEYAGPLQERIACDVVPVLLGKGDPVDHAAFAGADGVVVGGGLTPAYWKGIAEAGHAIRDTVAGGVPYLGFSAGAMVAPGRALIGGYRINGIEVCGEECSEGLVDLEFRPGLGIAPFAVDVHAAQAGTLSRATGAVAAGLVDHAVAIDEGTAIILAAVDAGDYTVIGAGTCWDIRGRAGRGPGLGGGAAVVTARTAERAGN
ncbi:Type 1 glutamine amidotransferase-like domain-containing protein [Pseudarthrobacter chlorophenolicus]|uniref:Type 1 glutamine amidotransferase-like domain-containing protein n=1 Tax=Pseudarthrobacter chlorophenolicus TaxID=85085 RepID=UPI0005F2CC78|nr:Type 1 glutamine amidotransferase-like domain-containing protein [Pseudarthrobacter chlorophenolicus]